VQLFPSSQLGVGSLVEAIVGDSVKLLSPLPVGTTVPFTNEASLGAAVDVTSNEDSCVGGIVPSGFPVELLPDDVKLGATVASAWMVPLPKSEETEVGSSVPTGDSVAFTNVLGSAVPIFEPSTLGDIVLEALFSPEDIAVGDMVPDGIRVPSTPPEETTVGDTVSRGCTEAFPPSVDTAVGETVSHGLMVVFAVPSKVGD